jgi:hypothetical protein
MNFSGVIREATLLLSVICGFIAGVSMGVNGAFLFTVAYVLGWVTLWSILEEEGET